MNPNHHQLILYFILRPEMYIGSLSKEKIEAFLIGFEVGTRGEYKITSKLSTLLSEEYNIKKSNLSWIKQVEEYSKSLNIDWISGLVRLILKNLNKAPSKHLKKAEIHNFIHKSIHSLIFNFSKDRYRLKQFKLKWQGICNLEELWFSEIWNYKELELVKKVDYIMSQENFDYKSLHKQIQELTLELEK